MSPGIRRRFSRGGRPGRWTPVQSSAVPVSGLSRSRFRPRSRRRQAIHRVAARGRSVLETPFLQPFNLAHFAHELGHLGGQALSLRSGSRVGDYMLEKR